MDTAPSDPSADPHLPPADKTVLEVSLGLLREPLYWLLAALPVALVLRLAGADGGWIFLFSAIAIIPLAGLMGRATENLAETLGAGLGGLLNATFGNAAELIIALLALSKGPELYPLVKASITGSIIGNVLLVLGLSILLGGFRFKRQKFNATAASLGATQLTLAVVGLVIPAVFWFVVHADPATVAAGEAGIVNLSEEIAVVLALTYVVSLWFSLRTHSHLFAGHEDALETTGEAHRPEWDRKLALTMLIGATAGVAVMSELLVGSVEEASHALGMNGVFVGVIVVAVIGNAAEHSTAVLMALKNKMDLAVTIAIGSGIQIALFVAPVLVFASLLMGGPVLDLHFSLMEVVAVVLSVFVVAQVCNDGESHWMEGVLLLAVYVILGLAFYNLPMTDTMAH